MSRASKAHRECQSHTPTVVEVAGVEPAVGWIRTTPHTPRSYLDGDDTRTRTEAIGFAGRCVTETHRHEWKGWKDSNLQPPGSEPGAPPIELHPQEMVDKGRIELPASRLSDEHSNLLSYMSMNGDPFGPRTRHLPVNSRSLLPCELTDQSGTARENRTPAFAVRGRCPCR